MKEKKVLSEQKHRPHAISLQIANILKRKALNRRSGPNIVFRNSLFFGKLDSKTHKPKGVL